MAIGNWLNGSEVRAYAMAFWRISRRHPVIGQYEEEETILPEVKIPRTKKARASAAKVYGKSQEEAIRLLMMVSDFQNGGGK